MKGEANGLKPGTVILDRYRVEQLLGEGGLGTVLRAFDNRLKRTVAVKMIKRASSGTREDSEQFHSLEERFAREAEAGARMRVHPNLVTVYDLVVDPGGTQYLILEYLDGGTVASRIARGPLAFDEALTITADVAAGLQAAHAHGIVHRDIKPSNIFLTEDGTAKVGDFSIAQIDDLSRRTQTTTRHPGTPLYMSPEQVQSTGYVRPSSDQYSLGLVLFEMLTGKAYKRLEDYEVGALLAVQPSPVARVVRRTLAGKPGERYPDMSRMLADIHAAGAVTPPIQDAMVTSTEDEDSVTELSTSDSGIPRAARSSKPVRIFSLSRRAVITGLGTMAIGGTVGGALFALRDSLRGTIGTTPTPAANPTPTYPIAVADKGPFTPTAIPTSTNSIEVAQRGTPMSSVTSAPANLPPSTTDQLWYYLSANDGALTLHSVAPSGKQNPPVQIGQNIYAEDVAADGSATIFFDNSSRPSYSIYVGKPDGTDRALVLQTRSLIDDMTIDPHGDRVAFWLRISPLLAVSLRVFSMLPHAMEATSLRWDPNLHTWMLPGKSKRLAPFPGLMMGPIWPFGRHSRSVQRKFKTRYLLPTH